MMRFDHLRCGREGARTVVLCSGLGGSGGYWRPHLDRWRRDYDLILYDQRGTGANSAPLGPVTIADFADDLLEVCDAAGVARFDLIGHALGGLVGFDLACRAPARLDRLVAINAWPAIDAHTARCFDIRLATLQAQGVAAFAALQQNFLYPPFWISAHPDRIAAEEAHVAAHFQGQDNLRHRIDALRAFRLGDWPVGGAKVLLVSALDDALVDAAQSRRLAQLIPGAQLREYPQGGHAVNLTQQPLFEADVQGFLRRD